MAELGTHDNHRQPVGERMKDRRLSILMVATKLPYPPIDGGRLLMWRTIEDLAARGHRVTLVCPNGHAGIGAGDDLAPLADLCRLRTVDIRPKPLLASAAVSILTRAPLTVVRHTTGAVRRAVRREIETGSHDVIHAEQTQAIFNVSHGLDHPPVVLRCQNVESRLWDLFGRVSRGLGPAARWESRRIRGFEARALCRADVAVALTDYDRRALIGLARPENDRDIRVVTAPFPPVLPASERPLEGDPPITLLDGAWWPHRDATDWFLSAIWPEIRRILPGAVLHCYGNRTFRRRPGAMHYPSPLDSREVFAPNSILAVPLRIASGLRMKILEAWARGVPVVAMPEAARGIEATHDRNVLISDSPEGFARAIQQLRSDRALRERLIEGGRATLATHHDPQRVCDLLLDVYGQVTELH